MAKYDYDVCVIGAGSAGLTMAYGMKFFGFKVLVIDKNKIGGDCLHYGCVPSKTIIKTAKVYHQMRNANKYGLPKVTTKPSFSRVLQHVHDTIGVIEEHENPEWLRKQGLDTIIGLPTFMDRHTVHVNGKEYKVRKFAICTGSRARKLPIDGLEQAGYLTSETFWEMKKQPASLLVIGGGPIGTELSQVMARLGTKVTIVNKDDHILPREPEHMAQPLQEILIGEGIKVVNGVNILRVRKNHGKKRITYVKNGKEGFVEGDEILLAVGRQANSEGLGLENAGVATDTHGRIRVNKKLRTTAKNIYACGDVIGGLQFTHTASMEAGVVIANMVFRAGRKANYSIIPWVTYTDPELAHVGHSEMSAEEANIRYRKTTYEITDLDRAIAENERKGKAQLLFDKKGRVIGGTILAHNAGELIHEVAVAIKMKATAKDISFLVHAYPTMSEAVRKTAREYIRSGADKNSVKKLAKFLFKL